MTNPNSPPSSDVDYDDTPDTMNRREKELFRGERKPTNDDMRVIRGQPVTSGPPEEMPVGEGLTPIKGAQGEYLDDNGNHVAIPEELPGNKRAITSDDPAVRAQGEAPTHESKAREAGHGDVTGSQQRHSK